MAAPYSMGDEAADLDGRAKIFDAIAKLSPLEEVKKLSRAAREALTDPEAGGPPSDNYRYGHLDLQVMTQAMQAVQESGLAEDAVFVDLGSGTGHAVFAAALLHPFKQAIGCEILEPLHLKAKDLEQKYYGIFAGGEGEPAVPEDVKKVELTFLNGDFRQKIDEIFVPGVCVICCVGTCWDDELMQAICDKAAEPSKVDPEQECVKPGCFCITFSKMLPDTENWEVILAEPAQCSWGQATLFVHKKKGEAKPVEIVAG